MTNAQEFVIIKYKQDPDGGGDVEITGLEKWHFELTESAADKLLRLVLDGKKKATSSALRAYEAENIPLPRIGDRSVITFWDGTPGCVIETVNVNIIPFCAVTFDLAKEEGEDDELESWREKHRRFFTDEGKEIGYEFSEDMPVVFENFKVIEILNKGE